MTRSTSYVHQCFCYLHIDQIYDVNVTKWRQIIDFRNHKDKMPLKTATVETSWEICCTH